MTNQDRPLATTPSMMTHKDALKEALRRWGESAVIRIDYCHPKVVRGGRDHGRMKCLHHGMDCKGDREVFKVGRQELIFFSVKGYGDTWEAAFTRAGEGRN